VTATPGAPLTPSLSRREREPTNSLSPRSGGEGQGEGGFLFLIAFAHAGFFVSAFA
jgi:hypothetical protein